MQQESDLQSSLRTSDRHIPWWMAVIGSSYILTFGLIAFLILRGPAEPSGFVSTFSAGAMVIHSVNPDSQVGRGGLLAGDRVLTIDGRPVGTVRAWTEATGNSQAWSPQTWEVSRGGERIALKIVPVGISLQSKLLGEGYVLYLSLALTGFFLGLLIAWKRPADPVGRIGAWFIITASIAFGLPVGWAVPWRALPYALQLLLWIPQLSRFVLEAIFLSFFVVFPRRLVTRRWVWLLIWAPVLATLPWRIKAFFGVIHPGQVSPVPGWILTLGFVRTMVYLLIGIVILAVSYRWFLDVNEKRRVRVLMWGTAVSLISATVMVWFDAFPGRMTGLRTVIYLVFPFSTACPVSLGYAILRHRVLDISVIVRQGLQYAFARGAVIGFVPVLAALFILDFAANRQQTVAEIFRSRGWVYAALAGLSLVAYWRRREWLEAIDRRFFRERYNAQKVLREVVFEIGSTPGFERAAARVLERIQSVLHPEFAALMACPAGASEYRATIVFPPTHGLQPLPAESKCVALLNVLAKPLEIMHGDLSWLDQRLPAEEKDLIRRSRIDLLVPVATTSRSGQALLAFGIKRSEEPYTREDQELLETIAASLKLLLEQTSSTGDEDQRKDAPPRYPPASALAGGTEAFDATITSSGPLRAGTRLGPYEILGPLGAGGMGKVYRARDTRLSRLVAIKISNEEFSERFEREARAVASLNHPYICTLHDVGPNYLVMEYIEGEPITGPLPIETATEFSRQILIALEAAHSKGIIHRDLKPSNILLTKHGIKLLDFGLAKMRYVGAAGLSEEETRNLSLTHPGAVLGTPAYMSPEQLRGQPADQRADIWAFGCVMFELLAAKHPFKGETLTGTVATILEGKPDWNLLPTSTPKNVRELLERCLQKYPDQRPGSAADALRLLTAVEAGGGTANAAYF